MKKKIKDPKIESQIIRYCEKKGIKATPGVRKWFYTAKEIDRITKEVAGKHGLKIIMLMRAHSFAKSLLKHPEREAPIELPKEFVDELRERIKKLL